MWRACRLAALRQLQAAPAASAAQTPAIAARWLSTLGGMDRDELLARAPAQLRADLGPSRLVGVKKALSEEFAALAARGDASWDDVRNIFVAAQKVRAVPAMMDAFTYMEQHFPAHIDFMVYGEVFRQLLRARDGDKMLKIYEVTRPRYQSVPEMVYRFGIVGNLELGNLDEASRIWQEMLDAGHEMPNETTSRLIMAYARAGNADRARELFDMVDPQVGQWHETAIDRVIVAMGMVEEPHKAFEFYMNSSMKLNGGTLISLLSVCIHNDCKQQAADILANRKKFDLELDARAYNRIMLTLEFLEKHDEIVEVLEEMRENNVAFDSMTRTIINRNREGLQGTPFADEPMESEGSKASSLRHSNVSGKIREHLKKNEGSQAAAIVDTLIAPLTIEDVPVGVSVPEGALKIGPSLAKDSVRAYIMTGQLDKIEGLLKTFGTIKGNYGHAIAEVMAHFKKPSSGDSNGKLAYLSTKAMLFQGRQIFRVDEAMKLFRKFGDVEAAMTLFDQAINEYTHRKSGDSAATSSSSNGGSVANDDVDSEAEKSNQRYSQFNIGSVINLTLQVLIENDQLDRALQVIGTLNSSELRVTPFNYVVVFTSMREASKKPQRHHRGRKGKSAAKYYDANAYEQVWDDLKQRKVHVSKALVGNACPGFLHGNKRQRLKLLEAYADVKNLRDDDYVLPKSCFSVLLKHMSVEGGISELNQLYDEAIASLKPSDTSIPKEWITTMIDKLASEGLVDEAHAIMSQMSNKSGQVTYEAAVAVLRSAVKNGNADVATSALTSIEQGSFYLNLADAYELVYAARDHGLANVALEVVRIFETSNANEDGSSQVASRYRSDHRLRGMYRAVLQLCEQNGQWKVALKLREQIAALWGKDAADEHSKA